MSAASTIAAWCQNWNNLYERGEVLEIATDLWLPVLAPYLCMRHNEQKQNKTKQPNTRTPVPYFSASLPSRLGLARHHGTFSSNYCRIPPSRPTMSENTPIMVRPHHVLALVPGRVLLTGGGGGGGGGGFGIAIFGLGLKLCGLRRP